MLRVRPNCRLQRRSLVKGPEEILTTSVADSRKYVNYRKAGLKDFVPANGTKKEKLYLEFMGGIKDDIPSSKRKAIDSICRMLI
ncbi:hypothetical protein Trydic_g9725 [Trypoxylus dichotomus]